MQLRASDYGLKPSLVSEAILDVLDCLTKAGYEAYIVGGGVRDLLLGHKPKDFDAATNATPAQVKQVFGKRCRIIGKRFELAHVYSGRELIEVATFRAPPKVGLTTSAGMITRDNVWGTIEQDFARRDFTINAMYYQPRDNVILDFCQGMDDIQQKRIRFLGKPAVRIKEDPVRLLRVLRFAAKLDFKIDDGITQAMTADSAHLLTEVSPHRLFDETQKLFTGGSLLTVMQLLIKHHIWSALFGKIPAVITPFIERSAVNTDLRINAGKSINPSFFFAVLLWQPFLDRVNEYLARNIPANLAWTQAGQKVLNDQDKFTAIPKFAQTFMREIWELQPRLTEPRPRLVPQLALHPRFRAGFDFLHLRELSGDASVGEMGTWWEHYQQINNDQREHAINQLIKTQQRRLRQKRTTPAPATLKATDLLQETMHLVVESQNHLVSDDQTDLTLVADVSVSKRRVRNRKAGKNTAPDPVVADIDVMAEDFIANEKPLTEPRNNLTRHSRDPLSSEDPFAPVTFSIQPQFKPKVSKTTADSVVIDDAVIDAVLTQSAEKKLAPTQAKSRADSGSRGRRDSYNAPKRKRKPRDLADIIMGPLAP